MHIRGFGWRIHCGVEVTESVNRVSINNAHSQLLGGMLNAFCDYDYYWSTFVPRAVDCRIMCRFTCSRQGAPAILKELQESVEITKTSLKRNAKCIFFSFIWFVLFVTRLSASSRVALRSAQEFGSDVYYSCSNTYVCSV